MTALVTRVERTDVGEVLARGLHTWLDELQRSCSDVGTAIHESFVAVRRDV
jgi:uncharacterized alpha-E superfamily protein